ncbi:MAG: AAA family ATPase [Myxococcaceae bacterium]
MARKQGMHPGHVVHSRIAWAYRKFKRQNRRRILAENPKIACMKREIEHKLQVWAQEFPRKPLILKGLRQCGKTYLLKNWSKQVFRQVHYVNFEQDERAEKIFKSDLKPNRIIEELNFLLDTSIDLKQDVLILDEIQACQRALTSLKYFNEELPEMAVIGAGSLLGLHLGTGSFPVGKVEIISMFPMTFEEFLLALGEHRLLSLETHIPETAHDKFWKYLMWYFVTGGMPEVVQTFLNHREDIYTAFDRVRKKQKQLLLAYYADFAKHSGKENAMHIERVWNSVPSQLASSQDASARRFQFSGVVPGIDRYRDLSGAIDWLIAAGLVLPAGITNHAAIPLSAFCKPSLFKLYCCDVGLLGAMSNLSPQALLQQEYGNYKGYFAENFVAQEFSSHSDERLVCWQQQKSEIKFVRLKDAAVIPVEVKSGRISKAKSLDKFMKLYQPPLGIILIGAQLNINSAERIEHHPLYLAGRLVRLLSRD